MNILKRINLLHLVIFLVISISTVLAIITNYPYIPESSTTSTERNTEYNFSKPSEGEEFGFEHYRELCLASFPLSFDVERFIEEDGYIVLTISNSLEQKDIKHISNILSDYFIILRMNKDLFRDGVVRLENDGKIYDINVIEGMQ